MNVLRSPQHSNRLTAIVLLLGINCSLALFAHDLHQENLSRKQLFATRASQYFTDVATGMERALHASVIVNQAFGTFGALTREQFREFATPLLAQYPYLVSLGYQRPVADAGRQQFEADRAGIFPGDYIAEMHDGIRTRALRKTSYMVIDYVVPDRAMGIDARSWPAGDDAPERAAATGQPAASAIFPLFQTSGGTGFRILLPTYHARRPPASAAPHAGISGFTTAVIQTDLLFRHILKPSALQPEHGVGIRIYSGAAASPASLLYQSLAQPATQQSRCWFSCEPTTMARTYQWAGKQWHVSLVELPDAAQGHGSSLELLAIGLLLTAAAAFYVHSQQSRTDRIQRLVGVRTEELRKLNTILLDDITQRKQVLDDLSRSQRELRELAEHNAVVKEEERKRIAREIHDDLGQSMLALRIDLALIGKDEPNPFTGERINRVLTQIDTTMGSMRMIINELRPSVLDLGIDAAIEWVVAKFHRRTGIECRLDLRSADLWLSDNISTALYRIVQESMTNIMRHARATLVEVAMWSENGWVFLTLFDNGVGISEQCRRKSKSFGLIGIAERIHALGGTFDTESKPGQGTRFTIALPYAAQQYIDTTSYANGQQRA